MAEIILGLERKEQPLPFGPTCHSSIVDTELSVTCVDRLEAAMAKLAVAQTSIFEAQTSMASKLDVIIQILNIMVPRQPSPSFASTKSPPMPPLLPKVTNPSSSSAKPPSPAETKPPPPTTETTPPSLPMVASHLPVNKHHTFSSDPLLAANVQSHTKPSSHGILPSDIRFSLFVVCVITVRDTNLHHPFFLLLFAILIAAKGLCLRNHLQALIPTPIFIWDSGSVFCTQHLEDKVFLMG
ncbi:hypothetical protein HKD37_15G042977 [Glycine soja]